VVGEASDGLEAVHQSEELQPDLIVLDIGLPILNGIEAARRIRKLAPKSKILFLSQESSADVVQEALNSGALGYLVKTQAGSELLPAVDAVLQGRKSLSSGLSGNHFIRVTDSQASAPCHTDVVPSPALEEAAITRRHEAQFRSDDASLLAGYTSFIEAALRAGNAVIVVVTEPHRKTLLQSLRARGLNIDAAIEQGRYIPLDLAETLSTLIVNGLPDPVLFLKFARDLVEAAAKAARGEHPRVVACGECAPVLRAQGNAEAAIQLEHLWDEVAKSHGIDILCGYVLKSSQCEQESEIFERISAEHSAVHSK